MGIIIEWVLNRVAYRLHRLSQGVNYFLYNRQFSRPEYHQFETITTWTKQKELEALYHIAASLPHGAYALEIGSYLGASSCYLASGLARIGGHLFCVDTWRNETMSEGERDTFAEFMHNTRILHPYITPLRMESSQLSAQHLRIPLHLVFIDGDHSYLTVKSDFERVTPWLARDGTVVFHDSNVEHYPGVSRVIGEALLSGNWKVSGVIESLLWLNPLNNPN